MLKKRKHPVTSIVLSRYAAVSLLPVGLHLMRYQGGCGMRTDLETELIQLVFQIINTKCILRQYR